MLFSTQLGWRSWVVVITASLLTACIGNPLSWDPDTHVVQSGETLATLALRYEVRVGDLVAWNALTNPDRIYPGQKLRVARPPDWSPPQRTVATTTSSGSGKPQSSATLADAPPTRWFWPASGPKLAARNAAGVGDGIDIGGKVGDPIFAASDGKVVYSGSGLSGYGNLLIIKHNERYLSAYGHNESLLVAEGAKVRGGERVATMGKGPGQRAMLHFEIRRDGKPVDPLKYLKKQ